MTMFDLISPDAFTSLWYWIVVALVWTRVTHAPLGVPAELYARARAVGGDDDAFALLRAGVARHLMMVDRLGPWLVGLWAFLLTSLAGMALMDVELAQAVLLIAAPLAVVQLLVGRTARRMSEMDPELDPLMAEFSRLRLKIQGVGLVAIFASAVWGMLYALSHAMPGA